ncbi:MAG: AAA family ATPase, partial [Isosphaeraceae bacterium]
MGLDSGSLIKTLNKTCLDTLQAAAGLCLSRTNPTVEIEHWLLKLVEAPDTDLKRLFRQFEVDPARVQRDLTQAIDQFKTGSARTPSLSTLIDHLIREAWVLASIQYHQPKVRSGMLLLALLSDDKLSRLTNEASREFAKISVETLWPNLLKLVDGSAEDEEPAAAGAGGGSPGTATGKPSKTPGLDQYTIDLTAKARAGGIDPVLGRDAEIRQMVDILIRRRQNNPILTGEAGVGKTAVVEGFARRVAEGDVPEVLKAVAVRSLDMGLLQAGAGVKGEFENRLKQVIAEVKASSQPIILFIDEAHTMIGAGGQAGQNDAANLLKPALARGELRTIAATTWAEFKKYFEKDAALARRFQVVKVEEPTETSALIMMRGLTDILEKHHSVRILDEAVDAAVRLSARYITGRQLPDKSLSLLDTACSRVAIGQGATPPEVEDCTRRIESLNVEIKILNREGATGARHDDRLTELTEALANSETRLTELNQRWEQERTLVNEIRALRDQLEAKHAGRSGPGNGQPADPSPEELQLRSDLEERNGRLRQLQGETPLMQVCVDSQTVAAVVSGWTGVPVGKMMTDEINTVLNL